MENQLQSSQQLIPGKRKARPHNLSEGPAAGHWVSGAHRRLPLTTAYVKPTADCQLPTANCEPTKFPVFPIFRHYWQSKCVQAGRQQCNFTGQSQAVNQQPACCCLWLQAVSVWVRLASVRVWRLRTARTADGSRPQGRSQLNSGGARRNIGI